MEQNDFIIPDPISIPDGRKRIIFRLRQSGLGDIINQGWKPEWFVYFRKPREECAMQCTSSACNNKIQPMRKIAYCPRERNVIGHISTTLWECSICHKQFIAN